MSKFDLKKLPMKKIAFHLMGMESCKKPFFFRSILNRYRGQNKGEASSSLLCDNLGRKVYNTFNDGFLGKTVYLIG